MTTIQTIKHSLRELHTNESGATATEYIVLLVLVACFVIGAVKTFGGTVSTKYDEANDKLLSDLTIERG